MNTDAKFFNKIYLTKPVTDLKTRNYKKKIVKEILKGTNKGKDILYSWIRRITLTMERSSDPHKIWSQTCLWVFEGLLPRHGLAVTYLRDRDTSSSSPGRCGMWLKSSWRRSQLLEKNYTKRFSHCCEIPTDNPQGIWLWRSGEFDYRTSTGLTKQTLGGHKQNLVHTRTQEKGAVTPQARFACECFRVSSRGMGQQWPAVESEALAAAVLGEAAFCCKSFWRP